MNWTPRNLGPLQSSLLHVTIIPYLVPVWKRWCLWSGICTNSKTWWQRACSPSPWDYEHVIMERRAYHQAPPPWSLHPSPALHLSAVTNALSVKRPSSWSGTLGTVAVTASPAHTSTNTSIHMHTALGSSPPCPELSYIGRIYNPRGQNAVYG